VSEGEKGGYKGIAVFSKLATAESGLEEELKGLSRVSYRFEGNRIVLDGRVGVLRLTLKEFESMSVEELARELGLEEVPAKAILLWKFEVKERFKRYLEETGGFQLAEEEYIRSVAEESVLEAVSLLKPTLADKLALLVEASEEYAEARASGKPLPPLKWFSRANTKKQVPIVLKLLDNYFEFKVLVKRERGGTELKPYVVEGHVLRPAEEVVEPLVGELVARGLSSPGLRSFLYTSLKRSKQVMHESTWREDYLPLANGALDLETLKLVKHGPPYFLWKLPVKLKPEVLETIREGGYPIESNPFYQLYRDRFPGEEWDRLVGGFAHALKPDRAKLILLIYGPPDCGKSTLLEKLFGWWGPYASWEWLEEGTGGYTFGKMSLAQAFVWIIDEAENLRVKAVSALNKMAGARGYFTIHVKYEAPVERPPMKLVVISCNDPPYLLARNEETAKALASRINIVRPVLPEGAVNSEEAVKVLTPEKAIEFLAWCRWWAEARGWNVPKTPPEEVLEVLGEESNLVMKILEEELEYASGERVTLGEIYARVCERTSQLGVREPTYARVSNCVKRWLQRRGLDLEEHYRRGSEGYYVRHARLKPLEGAESPKKQKQLAEETMRWAEGG
jgi:hypothetical protein